MIVCVKMLPQGVKDELSSTFILYISKRRIYLDDFQ